MHIDITVTGMTCASCVSHVEKAVSKVKGVDSCTVNLLTGLLRAEGYNIEIADVIGAVKDAGYGVKTEANVKDHRLIKLIFSIIIAASVMAVSMLFKLKFAAGLICFGLAITSIIINFEYFSRGFKNLFKFSPNMDTLVAIGSACSFVYSSVVLFSSSGSGNMFFDSSAMILAFVSLGKYMESLAKRKAADAVTELYSTVPETCEIETFDGTTLIQSAKTVKTGDIAVIRPGKSIPVDGVITEGETEINEASLTGESFPVFKKAGDNVFAGTINLTGSVKARVTALYEDTDLAKTIQTVSDLQAGKAPVARAADVIAGWFVPAVLLLSMLTFIFHLVFGSDFGFSLERAVSVLVVSCPCALGLATPVAVTCAGLVATRNGVLFKSAEAMETTGKIKSAAFDKTGTVTEGVLTVNSAFTAENVEISELFDAAYIAECFSEHPIGKGIVKYVGKRDTGEPDRFNAIPGQGVRAVKENNVYSAGKPSSSTWTRYACNGTLVEISVNDRYLGSFSLSDKAAPGSLEAISEIRNLGIDTALLTGDSKNSVNELKDAFDICRTGLLPADKAEIIGKLKAPTMMVGDGINDAVALTASDVGFAMGEGTDVAKAAGSAVVKFGGLTAVAATVLLTRKMLRIIYENLFWALFYNVIGIPLAAGLFGVLFGWYLTPSFCALAMSFSSVLVVSNSLRILSFDRFFKNNKGENDMKEIIFNVKGMMCHNCERHAVNAVKAIYPETEVVADFEKGTVTVKTNTDVDNEKIKAATREEGYEC